MQKFEMRSGDVEISSPTTLLQPRLAPNAECTEDIDTGDEISGRRIGKGESTYVRIGGAKL